MIERRQGLISSQSGKTVPTKIWLEKNINIYICAYVHILWDTFITNVAKKSINFFYFYFLPVAISCDVNLRKVQINRVDHAMETLFMHLCLPSILHTHWKSIYSKLHTRKFILVFLPMLTTIRVQRSHIQIFFFFYGNMHRWENLCYGYHTILQAISFLAHNLFSVVWKVLFFK